VSVLETILYYVLPPAAVTAGIAGYVFGPRSAPGRRYRAGRPWPYGPRFWTANPEGAPLPAAEDHAVAGTRVSAERGGARGSW
jgi:hypothetical protein